MMKQWKHVLDFDKQETHIKEFNLRYPFKDTVPVLDIFQMPDKLLVKDIPPFFRPQRHDVHLTSTEGNATQPETVEE